MPEISLQD